MKKLHILNGDCSFDQFIQTKISGETLIWREILCEGPTITDLREDLFWVTRAHFLASFVQAFEPAMHKALKQKIQGINIKTYQEIILWFEYDLFCQINLLAILSWLHKIYDGETIISLICVGQHPNHQKLVGLGELTIAEFSALYPQRHQLNINDLAFANQIWTLYCSDKQDTIVPLITKDNTTAFPYLQKAFVQHQKRFPNNSNGLTHIEQLLLTRIQSSPISKRQLVKEILQQQEIYGFGDLQYFKILDNLSLLLNVTEDILYLNKAGLKVLNKELNYRAIRQKFNSFGGCTQELFSWDEKSQQLTTAL